MKLLTTFSAVGAAGLLLAGIGAPGNAAPLPVAHAVTHGDIHDGTAQAKAYRQSAKGGQSAFSAPQQQASIVGLPTWSTTNTDSITGTKYASTYVGANPALGTTSTINVYLVPLNMALDNGDGTSTTIDATAAANGVAQSPLFVNMAQKPSGENAQYLDAYMRANFNRPAGYHVKLNPVVKPAATLNVAANQHWDYPGTTGVSDTLAFNQLPQIAANYPSDGIVMFVAPNVLLDDGNGTASGYNGYHDYASGRAFGFSNIEGAANENLQALSHELSEWAFDPTVNNVTGGNTSTAGYGCQKILEVGDPVNNQNFTLTDASAKTWTVEDEVFVPWFFHKNPAGTSNGKYSILGVANYGASC